MLRAVNSKWRPETSGATELAWLGQAGFAIRHGSRLLLVDPYLSNHLAKKYKGSPLNHERMMLAPLPAEAFCNLNFVLCSHRHGDHMDIDSLPIFARNNPNCRFIAPRAELKSLLACDVPESQAFPVNAGERHELCEGITLQVISAAHERMEVDSSGCHRFVGFILQLGNFTIYHSGDCVPFAGQAEMLRNAHVDVALLPVNGRGKGVAGNMSLDEAISLCREAGIPEMVAHHFGMFSFNTVPPEELKTSRKTPPKVFIPNAAMYYKIEKT